MMTFGSLDWVGQLAQEATVKPLKERLYWADRGSLKEKQKDGSSPIRPSASEWQSVNGPDVILLQPFHACTAAPEVLATKVIVPAARTIATHAPAASHTSEPTAKVVGEVDLDIEHLPAALAVGRCLPSLVASCSHFRCRSCLATLVQRNHLVPTSRILTIASLSQVILGLQSDGRLLCFPLVQRHFLGLELRFYVTGVSILIIVVTGRWFFILVVRASSSLQLCLPLITTGTANNTVGFLVLLVAYVLPTALPFLAALRM
uniref:Uncharacterized protein n=1 Tax=Anopheles atroparvus TaxID=41427 RepID=A0A182JKC8_ANOAO